MLLSYACLLQGVATDPKKASSSMSALRKTNLREPPVEAGMVRSWLLLPDPGL